MSLPLAAGGQHFYGGVRGAQLSLEPGQLPRPKHGFALIIRGFVGVPIITAIEHEKIDLSPGELEVNTGITRLAIGRVHPQRLKRAQGFFLARHGAVGVVRPEVVVIPYGVDRHEVCLTGPNRPERRG